MRRLIALAVGISVALANGLLGAVGGSNFITPATWVQLHTGDPSSTGLANLSLVTTRQRATFAAPSNGVLSLTAPPNVWLMTGIETIRYVSVWSAVTGGICYWDAVLTAPQTVGVGDTVTLNALGLSFAASLSV